MSEVKYNIKKKCKMEDLGDDARMKISINTMPFLQKMEAND
jgi:hypothetical protein